MSTNTVKAIQSLIGNEFPSRTPFGKWLKGRVIDAKDNELTLEFIVRDDMTNPIGLLHGGIISAIIGEMAGFSVYSTLSTGPCKEFVMINSNTDFLSPAKTGDKITAKANIIREGKIAVMVETSLYRKGSMLMAKGTTNIIKLSNI